MNLTLNDLQWLICHKTKPNQTKTTVNESGSVSDSIPHFLEPRNWIHTIRYS